ncbi:aggregation-promoting factor C-terminal-like domain-containing protein [Arcanobacterium canis]
MATENSVEALFGDHALEEPIRPGTRRARRAAEREAEHHARETEALAGELLMPQNNEAEQVRQAEQPSSVDEQDDMPPAHDVSESSANKLDNPASPDTEEIPVVASPPSAEDDESEIDEVAPARRFVLWRRATAAGIFLASVATVASFALSNIDANSQAQAAAEGNRAVLVRATPMSVSDTSADVSFTARIGGKDVAVRAHAGQTYGEAFAAAKLGVDADDEVSVGLGTPVKNGAAITVVKVDVHTESRPYNEKFTTTRKETADLPKGETRTETDGKDGKGSRTYRVTFRDGKKVSEDILFTSSAQKRIDEVVLVGTGNKEEIAVKEAASAGITAGPPASPGSARAIAQSMLASYGWGPEQFAYLDYLWQRESNWRYDVANPSSGAYGIPQALPGSKMASAGADWRTNPATQIKWGLGYIKARYGSPAGAVAHSRATGWY